MEDMARFIDEDKISNFRNGKCSNVLISRPYKREKRFTKYVVYSYKTWLQEMKNCYSTSLHD